MSVRKARDLVIEEVLRRQALAREAKPEERQYKDGIAVGAVTILHLLDRQHWGSWWRRKEWP